MNILTILFWTLAFIVFYAYIGYGMLLYAIIKIKRRFSKKKTIRSASYEPMVSFIVPCYNEAEIIPEKIRNTLSLDYPADKLEVIFITDGSNDGSDKVAAAIPGVKVMHQHQRRGKSAAENRSVAEAKGEIIIFSDANTELPKTAIRHLVKHYIDPTVGAVSGEKRVKQDAAENAAGAGEGFYWKYESQLKRWDSELLTIVGAAGELFSFRKHLFRDLEEDTILDDFVLSLRITQKGYRVHYEPEATAVETSSANTTEELKRKIRISAGGWQAMVRLGGLMNVFRHPVLSFEYISHRVLRWSIAPIGFFLLLPLHIAMATQDEFYAMLLIPHLCFYAAALLGLYLENRSIRLKVLFIPYYFMMMNYAVIAGLLRYLKGNQSSAWERSQRKISVSSQPA